jgi:hypothetical protein
MTERTALEPALVDLGRHLSYPATPNLAPAVRNRLSEGGGVRPLPVRRSPTRRVVALVAALVLLVLAGALAISPSLRAAVLEFLGIPGVRIELDEETTAPTVSAPSDAAFGRSVSLAQAEMEVGFDVLQPRQLGDPDDVYLAGAGERASVTLVYEPRPGLPEAEETGVGLLLTEFRASTDLELIKKLAGEGVTVESVVVRGELGYWIEGPHPVLLVGPDGQVIEDSARISGNTLVWTRDGLTLRLEGSFTKAEALGIARSVG